jgi:uncharacterized iron-regulated membrane protein
MKTFKLFWNLHKWIGIAAALIVLCTATTGFLLLIKKKVDWIQPPTMTGAPGEPADFITNQQLFEAVFARNHPDFTSMDDIDRVDFRPAKRVFKVRSEHNYSEIQVCAVTGSILSVDDRPSDLLESIHDGSFFAGWVHDWLMPAFAIALAFLAFSGLWLWIEPVIRRRKRKKRTL